MQYAGFWKRFFAMLIDSAILSIVFLFLGILVFMGALSGSGLAEPMALGFNVMAWVITTLYFAVMESSDSQATLGKMALGIKVTDSQGRRLTFANALLREVFKIVSTIIIYIGYIMAAFTEKKQALHDIMAGTLVVDKNYSRQDYYAAEAPSSVNDDGLTPLMKAVYKGDNNAASAIIESGADINAVNPFTGTSALWMAAAFGNAEVVRILIAKGADLNNKNVDGVSVTEIAAQMGHAQVLEALGQPRQ